MALPSVSGHAKIVADGHDSSLSQDTGAALGTQAGEARLREIVTSAGFATLRRVAETPVKSP
jgi:hypothetical protein